MFKFLVVFIISIIIVSCNDDENSISVYEGKIQFSAQVLESANKSYTKELNSITEISSALVTIVNEAGETVFESEKIGFYKFNDVYITEPLSLLTGNYVLTSFYLVNESDSVLYASPLESSSMAYLVSEPLPISFNISKDEVSTLYPEVISVENSLPEDFGYASFGLNKVGIFDFLLTTFKYNPITENFELTNADLMVTSGNDTIYNSTIEAVTSKITLQDKYEVYNISITKPGFNSFSGEFSVDSLKKHYSNPLTIIMEAVNIEEGIIAYYPFNGDSYDYSGNGNHATNYGALLTTDRFGNSNSAYDFDGLTNYMELTSTLDASSGLTFSFWVNSKGIQDGENNGTVICKYNMAYDYHCFSVSTSHPTLGPGLLGNLYASQYETDYRDCAWSNMMTSDDIPSQWDSNDFDLVNPMELPLNNWAHCVINVTETEIQAWINGILTVKKGREYSSYFNSDNEPTYIGNNLLGGDGSNNHFYGKLDDLKVYNRSLTVDDIQALYHEGGWGE